MRLDPTITYDDILMRMYQPYRPANMNFVNMRRLRSRDSLNLILWERRVGRPNDSARTLRILARLPAHQIAANTTEAPLSVAAGPPTIGSSLAASQINSQIPISAPAPIPASHQTHPRPRRRHLRQSNFTPGLPTLIEVSGDEGSMGQDQDSHQSLPRRSARLSLGDSTATTRQTVSAQPSIPHSAIRKRAPRRRVLQPPAPSHIAVPEDDGLDIFDSPPAVAETPAVPEDDGLDIFDSPPTTPEIPTGALPAPDNVYAAVAPDSDHQNEPRPRSPHPLDRWPITYGRTHLIQKRADHGEHSGS